ncbi:hypothetical protein H6F32_19575 [Anabaena sp. FACHB-1237]|uniref:hypothetical protein n=1 Tax=Anabaena sp. FACHB-1237 TaxID=2692769 RepID=UPI00167FFC64|nr:hypothetical protein [Anabaena sp. FACHB-1237]MBD2139701.1 hypothetical protein [Anabaena sp. FACHB-1237]
MLEIQDDQPNDYEAEGSEIITELSAGDKELLELIQKLLEPCDRTTYGERQREVAVFKILRAIACYFMVHINHNIGFNSLHYLQVFNINDII